MAHTFSITDGTTTFSLTSTNALLVNYQMGTAQQGDETVVDTVELLIYGATGVLMQTAYRSLQALLEAAGRRTGWQQGPRVYVQAQLDSDASTWRSEIVRGRIELTESSLAVWANLKLECTLYIERVPYWEGPRTQLTLSNGYDMNNTSGLNVGNANDTSRDNFALIDSTEITGDLPAPLEVQLTNNNGAARAWGELWLAVNSHNVPASMTGVIEAEARTSGGTVTALAGQSGGSYNLSTSVTAATWLYSLSASFMQACTGHLFRVLLPLVGSVPTGYARCRVTLDTGTVVLMQTEEVAFSSALAGILDLGTIPLPPAGYATDYGALEFALSFRFPAAASVGVDWIQFLPAYACRTVHSAPGNIVANETVVIDEIERRFYRVVSGASYPGLVVRGEPLMVWPGKAARILFMAGRKTNAVVPADTVSMKAWYRPRRTHI